MKEHNVCDNLKCGLLNWYPWHQGAKICFVGECTEELKRDILCRGVVEGDGAPYDYIVAVCLLEHSPSPVSKLTELRADLKPGGHLFLACENRMALRYFAGERDPYTHRVFDGIEEYRNFTEQDREEMAGRCYAQYEIERFLSDAGFTQRRGYSILPGLDMPQQIYAWDYLPEENLAIRYTGLYSNPQTIFLDVSRIYDSLVQNGMFHQMAGAYLIDCTIEGDFYEINHVTTSMDRGKDNATATIIQKDGTVCKHSLYPEGNARIEALYTNMMGLSQRNISVVPMEKGEFGIYNGEPLMSVSMPYIKAPTALEYLRELIHLDKQAFIDKTCEFMDMILSSSNEIQSEDELAPSFERVYVDLVPLNSFYKEGGFVVFDQEFCEKNYPIKVVLARALDIIYMGDKRMEEIVPSSYFIKRYDMDTKIAVYRSMGDAYIKKLRNREALLSYNHAHLADSTVINTNRQRINYSASEYNSLFIELMRGVEGKKIYVFGSGAWARKFIAEYGDILHMEALLDNNKSKQGQLVDGVVVSSPELLKDLDPKDYKVIVCIKQYSAVLEQLKQLGAENYGIYDPYIDRPVVKVATVQAVREEVEAQADVKENKKYHVGYIAGVFDLFHIGHLNLLRRAKEQCDILLVGVVSDEQASLGKAHAPYVCEQDRCEIVQACQYVDEAFVLSVAASGTRDVYRKYHFDVQFSGSDYEHDPNWLAEQAWLRERGSDLVFFPYTESTNSTKLRNAIEKG